MRISLPRLSAPVLIGMTLLIPSLARVSGQDGNADDHGDPQAFKRVLASLSETKLDGTNQLLKPTEYDLICGPPLDVNPGLRLHVRSILTFAARARTDADSLIKMILDPAAPECARAYACLALSETNCHGIEDLVIQISTGQNCSFVLKLAVLRAYLTATSAPVRNIEVSKRNRLIATIRGISSQPEARESSELCAECMLELVGDDPSLSADIALLWKATYCKDGLAGVRLLQTFRYCGKIPRDQLRRDLRVCLGRPLSEIEREIIELKTDEEIATSAAPSDLILALNRQLRSKTAWVSEGVQYHIRWLARQLTRVISHPDVRLAIEPNDLRDLQQWLSGDLLDKPDANLIVRLVRLELDPFVRERSSRH